MLSEEYQEDGQSEAQHPSQVDFETERQRGSSRWIDFELRLCLRDETNAEEERYECVGDSCHV